MVNVGAVCVVSAEYEASREPYEDEIQLCKTLIAHLQAHLAALGGGASAELRAACAERQPRLSVDSCESGSLEHDRDSPASSAAAEQGSSGHDSDTLGMSSMIARSHTPVFILLYPPTILHKSLAC